jgi:hypothetical protein
MGFIVVTEDPSSREVGDVIIMGDGRTLLEVEVLETDSPLFDLSHVTEILDEESSDVEEEIAEDQDDEEEDDDDDEDDEEDDEADAEAEDDDTDSERS